MPQIPLGRLARLQQDFEVALEGSTSGSYTIEIVRVGEEQAETDDNADGQVVKSAGFDT